MKNRIIDAFIDKAGYNEDGLINIYKPMTKAENMVFLDVVSKVVMQEGTVLP